MAVRLTLSGTNTYSGLTTIATGALNARNATALGSTTTGTTVTSGAALQLQGGIIFAAEPLTLNGTGVSNDGALRNISGNNTYQGAITLAADTRINSDSGTLTLDVASGNAIVGAFNLIFGGAGNITVADPIATLTGTVTKDGAGTLSLNATNTFSSGVILNGGILAISGGGSLGNATASADAASSPQIDFTGNSTLQIGGNSLFNTRPLKIESGVTATIDTG